jgi:hypothetical protein
MLLRFEKAGGEFGGRDMNCYLPLAQFLEKVRVRTSPSPNLPLQTLLQSPTTSIVNHHQHEHHQYTTEQALLLSSPAAGIVDRYQH